MSANEIGICEGAVSLLLRQVSSLKRPSDADSSAAVLVMVVAVTPFLLWVALAFFATWLRP